MNSFKNGHVQNIQKCQFLEKTPPEVQQQRQPGAFQNIPPQNKFISHEFEKVTFSKKWCAWWKLYRSKSILYWKPKWSVWSIWTYSTGRIFKCRTQKVSFGRKLKKTVSQKFENPNFQFSSKTHFFNHKFQDPSCRICSYGPYGPFWFSVIFGRDMEKRYQKNQNWEKWIFEITVKMNLFCGDKFSKAVLC